MIKLGGRAFSSPDIARPPNHAQGTLSDNDMAFEGIGANVKLLLKLIHEQSHANNVEHDDRRKQRVAFMITILDDVKARVEKYSQPVRKGVKEFRRCNTDLRPHRTPRDNNKKYSDHSIADEKEMLRRELQASSSTKKSLEAMCSSLGKEKEIMASELSRKVQELNGMEELVNDLKTQNQTLLAKAQACAAEHQQKGGYQSHQGMVYEALQDRNKALSDQLLKSLDGYRSLKRKYQDVKEENVGLRTTMEEIGVDVVAGLGRIHGVKQKLATRQELNVEEDISALECMFESLNIKVSKHQQKKSTGN